jgi:hypothetical protein
MFASFWIDVCYADRTDLRPVATTAESGPSRPNRRRWAKALMETMSEVPRDRPVVCYRP